MGRKSARNRGTSPHLALDITEDQWQRAIASSSGGCLIADAIKSQHPELSYVTVDMATIRVTDRSRGERYTYLTPGPAQHLLLSFDQGWSQATEQINLRSAVKIDRITSGPKKKATRQARKATLIAKRQAGESLTREEKASLTNMERSDELAPQPRPSSKGPVVKVVGRREGNATVVGGAPLLQGTAHPNLLRGRDRHFGAKLADAGQAFKEAVEQAVAQHLAASEEARAIQEPASPAKQQ
jgi:hypothetical protein